MVDLKGKGKSKAKIHPIKSKEALGVYWNYN
jgi:hypothetical protein